MMFEDIIYRRLKQNKLSLGLSKKSEMENLLIKYNKPKGKIIKKKDYTKKLLKNVRTKKDKRKRTAPRRSKREVHLIHQ